MFGSHLIQPLTNRARSSEDVAHRLLAWQAFSCSPHTAIDLKPGLKNLMVTRTMAPGCNGQRVSLFTHSLGVNMFDTSKLWRRLKNRDETGQSLVEFALVMIFIILPLIMVFIEASVMLYKYVALTNAAREGARAGSIYLYVGDPGNSPAAPDAGRSAAVIQAVTGTAGPLIPGPPDCSGTAASTTCQIVYGPSSAPIPDPLRSTDVMTVSLAHTHSLLFGALGNDVNIQARSSMRIEPSSVISGTGP